MRLTTLTRLLGGSVVVTLLTLTGTGGAGAGSGDTSSTDPTGSTDTTVAPTTTTVAPTTTTVAPTTTTAAPGSTAAPTTPGPSRSPDEVAAMLQTAEQSCDAAISGRLDTTARLRNRATDQNLTEGDRNAIIAILDRTDAGLNDLKSRIDNAPDGVTLRPECKSISEDYRVYRLVVPQVRLALASAGAAAAADKLSSVADKLESASQTRAAKRTSSVDVNSLLQDIRAKANEAKSQIRGIPGTALAVTVDQLNAGSGKPVLSQARKQLDSIEQLLDAAGKDAQRILTANGR
jgi:hypothetical protein